MHSFGVPALSQSDEATLFTPFALGELRLRNRVVMASMTRGRARNTELAPTALQLEYYRQRASAGLILTESTWISPHAVGFINVPGLYTKRQVEGWRAVEPAPCVSKVARSSRSSPIRARSPILISSAANYRQHPLRSIPDSNLSRSRGSRTQSRPVPCRSKKSRRRSPTTVRRQRNARDAGFDGVELHAATTYLLPEFLNSALNIREDAYGGSAENRARIVLEILEALIAVWGPGRVGIKISPTFAMGGFGPTERTIETYDHLVGRLNALPLSHLQVVRASNDLSGTPVEPLQDTIGYYRARFDGTLIANFGFDKSSATTAIKGGQANLVSFAKPFISNPDLVHRFESDLHLATSATETFYQGGAEGYVDYQPAD